MWKNPYRPQHEISQSFNDGIVEICKIENNGESGYKPVKRLVPVFRLNYSERKLGIKRYYAGKQNQVEISRVIRVPQPPEEITNQNIAVTEKRTQYRIDLVQAVTDVYPTCYDLTLTRITQTEEYPL